MTRRNRAVGGAVEASPNPTAICVLAATGQLHTRRSSTVARIAGRSRSAVGLWPLRKVLTRLPDLRRACAVRRPGPLQGVSSTATLGCQPCRVPALWETPGLTVGHRLVRIMLTSWSATEPGHGLCRVRQGDPTGRGRAVSVLLASSPHRILVRATNVAVALDDPPDWLGDFGAYLVGRHHPSRACGMLTRLGNRLADDTTAVHARTLLESVAADGPLARALEDFLTANKLAIPRTATNAAPLPVESHASMLCLNRCGRRWPGSPSTSSPAAIAPAALAPTRAGTPHSRPAHRDA
ncbi:hypothetical protein I552_2563 [Mycobacterium xenopi 3993]|nr:hypothetical protein I552_2563 [Mycobacterium xenopi 3993]